VIIISIIRLIGRRVIRYFNEIGAISILFYRILSCTKYIIKDRKVILEQMVKIGINSLPLITVVSIFTGAVSSWQAAYQFKGVISSEMTLDLLGAAVSAAILIELAPVLSGIVVAGRVGASIAAELGTMQVTEQIDALEALAIDPVRYLAFPRFTAGWTMLPVLVVYAGLVSHIGAYVVAYFLLSISTDRFFGSIQSHFIVYNIFSGLIKALVFGGGTALIGCSIGFRTSGGAEGVGRATIKAFVFSAAFILIADYFLAMMLF